MLTMVSTPVVLSTSQNLSFPAMTTDSCCNQTTNFTEPKTPISVLTLVELTGEGLIAIMAIVGNGFVLIAIASARSLQTVTNFYVASLAAADLLVGLLGIPCVIVAFNGLPTNFAGCLIVNSLIIVLTQISIFGLLVVAFERFFAIRYPYSYCQHCTPKTTAIIIVVTWTSGLVVGMIPIFGWNKGKMATYEQGAACTFTGVIDMDYMVYMNFFGFVLPPLITMFCIYAYIYAVVRKQIRKIYALQMAAVAAASAAAASSANGNSIRDPLKTVSRGVQDARNGTTTSPGIQVVEELGQEQTKRANGFQTTGNVGNDVTMTSSNDGGRSVRRAENGNFENTEVDDKQREEKTEKQSNNSGHRPLNKHEETVLSADELNAKQNQQLHQKESIQKNISSSSDSNSSAMTKKNVSSWKREIRAAKWFAVVLTVFAACWLPLHIMNCVSVFAGQTCSICVTFAVLLSHLNSAINPVLYAYSNSKFFAAFRRMLNLRPVPSSTVRDSTTLQGAVRTRSTPVR